MDCEVLVVGAGPAGSTAARLLAEEGIETVLIEKNLSFNKPCGGGIPSAGLEEFGILKKIQQSLSFNRVNKIKIVPPLSEPLNINLEGGEILIFERLAFDSFLRSLAEKSGVEIIEAELVNIDSKRKNQCSTVKKTNGETFKINSKYIIAADGINSKINLITKSDKPDYMWTVSLHLPESFSEKKDTCEFWFGNAYASFFYSWVFPGTNYLSVGTGAKTADKLKKFIDNFLKKRFNNVDVNSFKLRAYKIPLWKRRKFFKGNILFCGDALGTVMPVTFEGIYYAMKSAQFASEAIKQKKLKLYEKLCEERFLKHFSMMKKFQEIMFGDDEKIDQWLNIHRNYTIQQLAMAFWLRKEHGKQLFPLYLKAFGSFISRFAMSKFRNRLKV